MPGPFTNKWDDTFPPDTEFADLYASNLRDFRTDIQQRMASISGLDADRTNLNFWADDTTPPSGAAAKWNGILFFATDTGKIYQFQYNSANSANPVNNWVDVTLIIKPSTLKVSYVNGPLTNETGLLNIYTLAYPPLLVNTRVRFTINYVESSPTGGGIGCAFSLTTGGGYTILERGIVNTLGATQTHCIIIEGGNTGATNSQYWVWMDIGVPTVAHPAVHTTLDMSVPGIVIVQWGPGHPADSVTFYGLTMELM